MITVDEPRISVLMPTRNRPRMLLRAVEAIQAQSYQNWELIIKDGGDAAFEVLPKDDRIMYVHGKDRGIAHAMNQALSLAEGSIFNWSNDDDIMLPGTMMYAVETLKEYEWMYGVIEMFDVQGGYHGNAGGGTYNLESHKSGNICPQPTVFWTRELGKKAGWWDEETDMCCDYDMWIRFGKLAEPYSSQLTMARYTLHPGSISVSKHGEQDRWADIVRKKHAP
jgi:glycosyltransferase involved in cell wall biosynthesis